MSIDYVKIVIICLQVVIVMASTVLHEVAHAATAYVLGDPTAKEHGRLTLNPFAHLDLVGSFVLPLIMALVGGPIFAFAKPVPYNPNRLDKPVRDEVFVALAGPVCNLLQACFGALVYRVLFAVWADVGNPNLLQYWIQVALELYVYINLILMFFNLIPLPPLDGSSIISPLLRGKAREAYYVVQRNALPVLLGIMYLVPMVLHVDPVGVYLSATAGRLVKVLVGF